MCTPKSTAKKKSNKQDIATGKYSSSQAPKNSAADDLKMDLGLKTKNQAYYRDLESRSAASKKALADQQARSKKRKKDRRTDTTTPTTTTTTTTPTTTTTTPTTTTTTAPVGTIGTSVGDTSVTPESIYTQDPDKAMEAQELLAQDELKRQRIKRARAKQSLLRRRVERDREVGSGRRVLSGSERELNIQSRQAGTGRRGGAGRRSLITGSTGGIGYYSRFL